MMMYLNRFGRQDLLDRLCMYVAMTLVFGMGLNCENAFNPNIGSNTGNIFIVTYLILRALYFCAHALHAWRNPEFAR